MGYNTNYELTVTLESGEQVVLEDAEPCYDEIKQRAELVQKGWAPPELSSYDRVVEALYEGGVDEYVFGYACKWYYHDDDMRRTSKLLPTAIFFLYGEGEESGDIWAKYYQNGKSYRLQAEKWTPPPFDASLLEG